MKTLDELIELAGGLSCLAKIAGVNHSTIAASWRRTGRVPVERAQKIAIGLSIPLHEIRPDIWPPVSADAA